MEEASYSVVSRGHVLDGFDRDTVKSSLVALFGLSPDSADKVLSNRRVVIKKGLDLKAARRFGGRLKQAGLDVVLVKASHARPTDGPPSRPPASGHGVTPEEKSEAVSIKELVPFEFKGSGTGYFKIWLVNIVLSILTLGIYSAWAKVRRKRYIYGNTLMDGSAFEYLADPVKILKGRVLVAAAFIVYSVLQNLAPIAAGILGFAFIVVLPWIVIRALAFNARNSAFRNIRFNFNGSLMDAAKAYVFWPILVPFTLGILFPYVYYRQKAFMVENHSYGTTRFTFSASSSDYYRIFLKALVPAGIGVVLVIGLAFLAGPVFIPVAAALYLYLFAFFSVKTTNLLFGASRLDRHGFSASLKVPAFTMIVLTNTLGIVLTLGLFHPWAKIRALRYKIHNLALIPAGNLDGFVAAEHEKVSALGEEFGDFLDLDLGL